MDLLENNIKIVSKYAAEQLQIHSINTRVYTTTELNTDSSDKQSNVPKITKFESKEWVEQMKQLAWSSQDDPVKII